MAVRSQLAQEARALPKDERRKILAAIPETELHGYLAELFRAMNADYWVEVTHGATEFGKDVVIVRSDPLSPDVIAVVVKRGDIRAKTAGELDVLLKTTEEVLTAKGDRVTDELLSQIKQARSHPAELKGHFARLQVTKVLVLLVGEMSNNVRTRLEAELNKAGQVFDLAWLVDQFTDYYPQVFFDGQVVDFLDNLVLLLERDSFYSKSGKTLSECFVDPVVAQLDEGVTLDDVSYAIQVKKTRVKFGQFDDLLASHPRVLLVGDPGSGKSKVAAKLCIDRYRLVLAGVTRAKKGTEKHGIPLMMPARKLSEFASASELIARSLPNGATDRLVVDLLIIDGLDEVVGAERQGLLERAKSFADELSCGLLVTTRKLAALTAAPAGFDRYELLPLEFGQAIKLIEKVSVNREVLPALREGLQKIQAQVPMSPLSLLLLVELVAERKEVPSSITELYDRFLDLVFGRWDVEKGIEVLFEYVVKKRFLAALAYQEFRTKNRLEITKTEYDEFVQRYANDYGWDETKVREFLKEIERAGILSVNEEVYFRHRSFLDYFVALHLYDRRAEKEGVYEELVETYFDAIWSEVTFFFVGLGRDLTPEFIAAVQGFERPGLNLSFEKLMSGRLLQAGWHSTAKVKEDGVKGVLAQLAPVNALVLSLFEKAKVEMPGVLASATAVLASDAALGSVFLSSQVTAALTELESGNDTTETELLKRVALLWVGRRFMTANDQASQIKGYLKTVEGAKLEPVVEARFLLLGAIADGAHKAVLKAVGARLKRLAKRSPAALKALVPAKKPGFRRRKPTKKR